MDIVTFRVGDRLYGISAGHVCRVLEKTDIFPVPFMPPCYLGLLLYRSELYDVIDAGILFEGRSSLDGQPYRILLLKWDDQRLAVIPDAVIGLVRGREAAQSEERAVSDSSKERNVEMLRPHNLMELVIGLADGSGKIS